MERIEVGGMELAYLSEGQGPVVLLLHGFPDTAHSWDATRPLLAATGYRAVSPFLRGYHPSAPAPDGRYDIETLGRDALGLIDALAPEGAIVVGHDWGAAAAMAAAVQQPAAVRLLVTVGMPHPSAVRPTPALAWRVRHFISFKLPGAARALRAHDFRMVDDLVRRWSPAWDFEPDATAAAKACFAEPGSAEAAVAYYRQLPLVPPPWMRAPIEVDTVAFAGETDGTVVDLSAYEHAGRFHRKHYQVIRLPGGHFLHREHPEQFHTALLGVLEARGETAPA
jgi:pimeloyl-ACP methyl ester carboxylesterase